MVVKLPGYEVLGGRGSLVSSRGIATQDTTAVGRGLSNLGEGIAQAGAHIEKVKSAEGELDVLKARSEYAKGRIELEDGFNKDQDWRNYTKRFEKEGTALRDRAASMIRDPKQREVFRLSIADDEAQAKARINSRASALEKDEGRAGLTGLLEKNRETALDEKTDEATRNGLITDTGKSIDAAERAGYISEQEAQKLRTDWPREYEKVKLKRDIQRDPEGTGARLAGGSVVDRIIHAESSGRASAKNPKSSATGLGQFVGGTWLGMMKKHRKDLTEGKSDDEILAMRTDAALSREMTQRYADENAAILKGKGIPATDGNIYLMHHFGGGGGPALLTADPSKQASEVLPKGVIDANPHIANKTVGEVRAWAAKRVGEGGSTYRFLTEDDKVDARVTIEAEQRQREAQDRADARDAALEQAQVRTRRHDSYRLGIEQRTLTDPNQFLNDPDLDDGQKASLLSQHKSEFKKETDGGLAVQQVFTGPPGRFNRFDSENRATVDLAYETVGGAKGLLEGDPAAVQRLGAVVAQTDIVPKTAVETLRNGLASPTPAVVEQSLSTARALIERDQKAFDGAEGSKDIVDAATRFGHMTRDQQVPEPEAAARVREIINPSDPNRRATLQKAVKPTIKTVLGKTDEEVAKVALAATGFANADTFLEANPTPGGTAGQQAQIAADFREFFEARYLESGDPADAKRMAAADMKRVYALTRVSGQPVLMKYAPELAYPAVGGSHAYLGEQLVEAVREVLKDPKVKQGDVVLDWTPRTAKQFDEFRERGGLIARGHPRDRAKTTKGFEPDYRVTVRRTIDGQEVFASLPGGLFRFDPGAPMKKLEQRVQEQEAVDAEVRTVIEETEAEHQAELRAERERELGVAPAASPASPGGIQLPGGP